MRAGLVLGAACALAGCPGPPAPPPPPPPNPRKVAAERLSGRYLFWLGNRTESPAVGLPWCYLDLAPDAGGGLRASAWRISPDENGDPQFEELKTLAPPRLGRDGSLELELERVYFDPAARPPRDFDPDEVPEDEDPAEAREIWSLRVRLVPARPGEEELFRLDAGATSARLGPPPPRDPFEDGALDEEEEDDEAKERLFVLKGTGRVRQRRWGRTRTWNTRCAGFRVDLDEDEALQRFQRQRPKLVPDFGEEDLAE
ncbi:MAG: hypothetical protein D6731_07315 [Planctomycetota bacterium]|nr:MAG: hypothetical protein D6731_07315 [Planctomycetota bacterium]